MNQKQPLPWRENYLGFSWERFQRRNTWRTVVSYFGYWTALPFFLTANPMIGPVRPLDMSSHVPVQSQGTTLVGAHIPSVTDTGGSSPVIMPFTGQLMAEGQVPVALHRQRSRVFYDSPLVNPLLPIGVD